MIVSSVIIIIIAAKMYPSKQYLTIELSSTPIEMVLEQSISILIYNVCVCT